jgi:metal-sulfur cluster biosynthetic enzyme
MEKSVPESLNSRDGEEAKLQEEIQDGLRGVIDPGTGLDVFRMGLVRDMQLLREGTGYRATLTFRPSSPVCPMAFKLAWDIKQRVQSLGGIERVEVRVEGYDRASELEEILRDEGNAADGRHAAPGSESLR